TVSTFWTVTVCPTGRPVKSVLRTVSIPWAARLAATLRFRLLRTMLSDVLIVAVTPTMTIAKTRSPTTISTMVKPRSSRARRTARAIRQLPAPPRLLISLPYRHCGPALESPDRPEDLPPGGGLPAGRYHPPVH